MSEFQDQFKELTGNWITPERVTIDDFIKVIHAPDNVVKKIKTIMSVMNNGVPTIYPEMILSISEEQILELIPLINVMSVYYTMNETTIFIISFNY